MNIYRTLSFLGIISLLCTTLVMTSVSAMAESRVNKTFLGKALEGYDPVAYFTVGKPVEGSSDYAYEWDGATWLFSSTANKQAFIDMPEKYRPQYGGYCAWAVSQGYTANAVPEAWRIVDGKLYLNYSKGVQRDWEKDIPGHIASANKNWPDIKSKLN